MDAPSRSQDRLASDPETETVAVQVPGEEVRVLHVGETLDGGAVLPGFSVAVDDIFSQMQM